MGAIAVIDDSPAAETEEVLAVCRVLHDELYAFCTAWGLQPWRVYNARASERIPPEHFRHRLIDSSDQYPDWLGWHSSGGFFGNPSATTLTKDKWWDITADHECKEMRGNPGVDQWRPFPNRPGLECALEVCDPVQADWRVVGVKLYGRLHEVRVSNYVYPAWFDENAAGPWDAFGLCKGPGDVRPGGYMPIRHLATGVRDNVWGRALPWWAKQRRQFLEKKMQRLANGRAAILLRG